MTTVNRFDSTRIAEAWGRLKASPSGVWAIEFPSVADYLDTCTRYSDFNTFGEIPSRKASREGSYSFTGTRDWSHACELCTRGDRASSDRIRAFSATISAGFRFYVPSPVFDTQGDECDTGRYVDGEPECMYSLYPVDLREGGRKVVSVRVEAQFHCGIEVEEVARRGAAIASLIDALEVAGLRVELTADCSYGDGGLSGLTVFSSVRVKDADMPLDIDRVAFTLVNASYHRRIGFGFLETLPVSVFKKYYQAAYGRPVNNLPGEYDISLSSDDREWGNFRNDESAREWVKNQAKSFGVELED